eukprot:TRINITY_DN69_c2_g1_i3.p1 TRINITY_DN69_c2_g1~~TRINITY_DN69_c2_g1_i3.p1  ORF type:complete len:186 (+),score=34.46 TRINITY_DN69_c2_g1_i3:126-683(+)
MTTEGVISVIEVNCKATVRRSNSTDDIWRINLLLAEEQKGGITRRSVGDLSPVPEDKSVMLFNDWLEKDLVKSTKLLDEAADPLLSAPQALIISQQSSSSSSSSLRNASPAAPAAAAVAASKGSSSSSFVAIPVILENNKKKKAVIRSTSSADNGSSSKRSFSFEKYRRREKAATSACHLTFENC